MGFNTLPLFYFILFYCTRLRQRSLIPFLFLSVSLYDEADSKNETSHQGVYRYFVVQYSLPKNIFPVARLSIAFLSFIFGAFVVVVFGAIRMN